MTPIRLGDMKNAAGQLGEKFIEVWTRFQERVADNPGKLYQATL